MLNSSAPVLLVQYSTPFYEVSGAVLDINDPKMNQKDKIAILWKMTIWLQRRANNKKFTGTMIEKVEVTIGAHSRNIKTRGEMERESQRKTHLSHPVRTSSKSYHYQGRNPDFEPSFWIQFYVAPLLLDTLSSPTGSILSWSCFLKSITQWPWRAPRHCASQLQCFLHHS